MEVFIPSLDFVTDLTDKLSSQQINYAIITVQRGGSSGNKIHVFYDMPDKESVENIKKGDVELNDILEKLSIKYGSDGKSIKKRKRGDK